MFLFPQSRVVAFRLMTSVSRCYGRLVHSIANPAARSHSGVVGWRPLIAQIFRSMHIETSVSSGLARGQRGRGPASGRPRHVRTVASGAN